MEQSAQNSTQQEELSDALYAQPFLHYVDLIGRAGWLVTTCLSCMQATMVITAVRMPSEPPLHLTSQDFRVLKMEVMQSFFRTYVTLSAPLLVEADGDLNSPAGQELKVGCAP